MALYDTIGKDYNSTRQADPAIADKLYELLDPADNGIYLDIGCGTGNYLQALSRKGLSFYGVDPSATMLSAAKQKNTGAVLLEATAENIPLPDAFFDGCIAVLTIHHWTDMAGGLREIRRLLKPGSHLVMFSFTPDQVEQYWLRHYFPKMIERCLHTTLAAAEMERFFLDAGFSKIVTDPYFVSPGLQDLFMYAGKHAPERYLDAQFRSGISAFRTLMDADELQQGLVDLENDIATGSVQEVIRQYQGDKGDYMFFTATAAD